MQMYMLFGPAAALVGALAAPLLGAFLLSIPLACAHAARIPAPAATISAMRKSRFRSGR
jgi:hypothetical protein